VEQFAQNLRQLITSDGAAGAAEAGAGAEAGGTATAEEGADADPSPGDQPSTSSPAASSPVAAAAPSVSVTSTASAPPAAAQEDSINLVRLVGPAILKRVIPVAAGLAVLVVLGRRFRHLFRRDAKN